jgi:hypothetical protein
MSGVGSQDPSVSHRSQSQALEVSRSPLLPFREPSPLRCCSRAELSVLCPFRLPTCASPSHHCKLAALATFPDSRHRQRGRRVSAVFYRDLDVCRDGAPLVSEPQKPYPVGFTSSLGSECGAAVCEGVIDRGRTKHSTVTPTPPDNLDVAKPFRDRPIHLRCECAQLHQWPTDAVVIEALLAEIPHASENSTDEPKGECLL